MALCDHLLEAGSCADCHPRLPADRLPADRLPADRLPADRSPAGPPPEYGPWFEARYTGVCSGCDYMIRPGDAARHDGYDGYLCAACGDTGPGLTTVSVTGGML